MSIFWIYEKNDFGDEVPTGGIYMPEYILSMIFEENVIQALNEMDLDRMLWEEAIQAWYRHRKYLIQEETKLYYKELYGEMDNESQEFYYQSNPNFYKYNHIKQEKRKRGMNQYLRHRMHNIQKMQNKRARIVENFV